MCFIIRKTNNTSRIHNTSPKYRHPNVVKQQGFFYVEVDEKLKFAFN